MTHLAQVALGVDKATGEILAAVVTTNDIHDGTVLGDILDQIENQIEQVSTNGTYNHHHCYDQIAERVAKPAIHRARMPSFSSIAIAMPHLIRETRISGTFASHGRKKWKRDASYHWRSLAETTMFRFKVIFDGNLNSRKFENQAVKLFIKCAALNRMIQLAKPDSYEVKT